jgi:hypothetical protein
MNQKEKISLTTALKNLIKDEEITENYRVFAKVNADDMDEVYKVGITGSMLQYPTAYHGLFESFPVTDYTSNETITVGRLIQCLEQRGEIVDTYGDHGLYVGDLFDVDFEEIKDLGYDGATLPCVFQPWNMDEDNIEDYIIIKKDYIVIRLNNFLNM